MDKSELPRDQDGEIISFEEWSRDVDKVFGAPSSEAFWCFAAVALVIALAFVG